MTRILITGGTGFIGSELCPALNDKKHEVFSLGSVKNHLKPAAANDGIITADIREATEVKKIIQKIKPEVLIHLAALSSVGNSFENPIDYIETNFAGTVNVAEACRRYVTTLEMMIFASSIYVYKDTPNVYQKENITPLEPNTPYGITKLAAETYLLSLYRNYGFPMVIVRPSNIYGRKRRSNLSIVEKLIDGTRQQNEIALGSPDPIRDFLYISDFVAAIVKLTDNCDLIGHTLNISTSYPTGISGLAQIITNHTKFNGKLKWNSEKTLRPNDPKWLVADNKQAIDTLGWKPEIGLDEGIQKTIMKRNIIYT